jgi:hypothetical protein
MIGKIFITRSGYDPERGRHVKDPHLDGTPSLGACRPDIRRQLQTGDHIFALSGKIDGFQQFVMGGFEIACKIPAIEAYRRFPDQRLRKLEDGQLTGNIIVNARGEQHTLDNHNSFERRTENYVVGKNLIALRTPGEILLGRRETLEALQDIIKKDGKTPIDVVGRWGTRLTEKQVLRLREWLASIARRAN